MIVNKNSWHWKAAGFIDKVNHRTTSVSLCSYFWYVVGGIFSFTAACIGVILVGSILLFFLSYPLWQFWFGSIDVAGVLSCVIWLGFAHFIHYCTKDEHIPWNKTLFEFKKQTTYENKEPNIFVEYLKAKKRKICPILEVE